MDVVKVNNIKELGEVAASYFVDVLTRKKQPILGLATGSTPEKLYEILIEKYNAGEISFSNVKTFNLDEYVGVSENDPQSYRYFMNENLFNVINIKKENTYVPNGRASNPQLECARYEQLIASTGNVDLQLLGLGLNGHIGFNEPGTPFYQRTHVVTLDSVTREANARFFKHINDVPTKALTMGIGTIMDAKKILLLVQGNKKKEILHRIIYGEVTVNYPATVLQQHPDVTVITDIDI